MNITFSIFYWLTDDAEIDSLNKNARQGKDPDDVSIGDLK